VSLLYSRHNSTGVKNPPPSELTVEHQQSTNSARRNREEQSLYRVFDSSLLVWIFANVYDDVSLSACVAALEKSFVIIEKVEKPNVA
jgi:hypothetical protein